MHSVDDVFGRRDNPRRRIFVQPLGDDVRGVVLKSLVSALGCAQFPGDALAAVTRLDIISKTPYGAFKPGEYSR